ATITGNPTKSYDGTTAATLTSANYGLLGVAFGESFTVTQTSGTYDSKNVLNATTVTANLSAGDFTPGVGTSASNYLLPSAATGPGQITALSTTIANCSASTTDESCSAGVRANN